MRLTSAEIAELNNATPGGRGREARYWREKTRALVAADHAIHAYPRDWINDFWTEGGMTEHRCRACGREFMGLPRPKCKECESPPSNRNDQDEP